MWRLIKIYDNVNVCRSHRDENHKDQVCDALMKEFVKVSSHNLTFEPNRMKRYRHRSSEEEKEEKD